MGGCEGRISSGFSPWPVDVHLLPVFSHRLPSVCICLLSKFPLRIRIRSHWIRDHPNYLTLTWLSLLRPYLQAMSLSEILGMRISTYAIWGDTVQPLMVKSTEREKFLVPPFKTMPGCFWHLSFPSTYVREASAPV